MIDRPDVSGAERGLPAGFAPVGLADRLLAEAVRALEHDGATPLDEPAAEAAARRGGGDLESRVVHRAAGMSVAGSLRAALRTVRSLMLWTVLFGIVLALVSGAGAVRAALGTPGGEPVNFFWVLISLLGLQTLLLLAWFAVMILRPRSANVSPLGAGALAIVRAIVARTHHGPGHVAAVQATSTVFARGPLGRWSLSVISHVAWLAFNIGAVALVLILLSAKQYTFHWETTILSADAYERITRVLAAGPEAVGFPTPSSAQITATEKGGPGGNGDAARAWSGLLAGSLLVYGFAPRILLLGFCLSARRRAGVRYRLDTSAPGFLRLQPRLMPPAEASGAAADGAGAVPPIRAGAAPRSVAPGTGPPAIVGLEIEAPATGWPPQVAGAAWTDLGFADGRDERRRVCAALGALPVAPRVTAVACALTTTPDRGIGAFLAQIVDAARGPVALVLTGGQAMRERGGPERMAQRADDWRRLAGEAGIAVERVIELDLDHLTDTSRGKLVDLVESDDGAAADGHGAAETSGAGRLERAFAAIADAVSGWSAAPAAAAQAELHRAIAGHYRHDEASLRALFDPRGLAPGDVTDALRSGAERVTAMLPVRLRQSPRWLAAGAISGALGCIAIGTLLTPAAFAAIPAWTLGGAGLGGLLKLVKGEGRGDGPVPGDDAPADVAGAVRAATLFALLLDLQGRGEAAISRVLDRVLDEPGDDVVERLAAGDGAACAAWLSEVRHRLDLALLAETRS